MRNAPIVVEHHVLDIFRDHRNFGVRAGEAANRFERAPSRDDQELDAALELTPQDARINEAVDARKLRERVVAQVLDVLIGALGARNAAPLSADQAAAG